MTTRIGRDGRSDLRRIFKRFDSRPEIMVETGSLSGDSAVIWSRMFKHVYTIELAPHWFQHCIMRFRGTNVVPLFGDSAKLLPMLLPALQAQTAFFLDAHWYRSKNHRPATENPLPLFTELNCLRTRKFGDIVIVDDTHDFGKAAVGWDHVTIDAITDFVKPKDAFVLRDMFAMVLYAS